MQPYFPGEDTFLLADIVDRYPAKNSLEIGVGRGLITTYLAKMSEYVVGVDLSVDAIEETGRVLAKLQLLQKVDLLIADAATSLTPESFDLVVFNPPYLPSEETTDRNVDGGRGGISVPIRWFTNSLVVIKKAGRVLMVLSTASKLEEAIAFFSRQCSVRIVARRRLFFEELVAIEITRHG